MFASKSQKWSYVQDKLADIKPENDLFHISVCKHAMYVSFCLFDFDCEGSQLS